MDFDEIPGTIIEDKMEENFENAVRKVSLIINSTFQKYIAVYENKNTVCKRSKLKVKYKIM